MSLSVKFNDQELNEYLCVLQGFTLLSGVDRENALDSGAESVSGAEFSYTVYKERKIDMPFAISQETDLEEAYDHVQKILQVSEPKKLVFGNMPDRYFLAVPEGDLDFEEIAMFGKGTITWVVPDGVAHAATEKTFQAAVGEDGILSATIINGGTEAVPVDYTVTHHHENGYIGIASQYGAIQLGKVEEADGETYDQNEKQASISDFQALQDDHGTNAMHPDHEMIGGLIYQTIGGRPCLMLSGSLGAGTPGRWRGGMRTLELPEDSEGNRGAMNFYCYLNHWFETGLMGQTAEQSIAFLTEDNKEICGYSLYKADMSGNTAYLEMRANGKILSSMRFTPSAYDIDNPFNSGRGHSDIMKTGSKVQFYWFGSYPYFTVPEIEEMECTKIQVAFTQYAGRDLGDQYVTRNYLREIDFQKLNVEKWRDIPNRYAEGDVVYIDGKKAKIYVNGMERQKDEIRGSSYFLVPPGETQVRFFCSSFSTPGPSIEAKIREAYV